MVPLNAELDTAAANETADSRVGALQPSPPDPRAPFVLQAVASVSFDRLDTHVKVVRRLTLYSVHKE